MKLSFSNHASVGLCVVFAGACAAGCAAPADDAPADDGGTATAEIIVGCNANGAVFLRHHAALGMGHVGFAYFSCLDNKWYYGSVENPSGAPHVPPGGANGGFFYKATTFDAVLNEMRGRGYVEYKLSDGSFMNTDPDRARQIGGGLRSRGYDVLGNNCMDAVHEALSAYFIGQISMGDPTFALSPNLWYHNDLVGPRWRGGFAL